jgi:AraC-like DNA-binding protein
MSDLVATVLHPGERPRLDAAAAGRFLPVHAETIHDALRFVKERPVQAVLVSPRRVTSSQMGGIASLVAGFPSVQTVAVLSKHDSVASERLLEMGACGVRRIVDLSDRDGWHRLRAFISDPASPLGARILARTLPALNGATADCHRFFEVMIRLAPSVSTVRELARRIGVQPSTFMSRFFRARVPSPKRYLAAIRLIYAAGLLESRGLSIADVAYRLEYSSPQSFGRHVRSALGVTAAEFRRRFPFSVALDDFVARLIVPYAVRFRRFCPLERRVTDHGLDRLGVRSGQARDWSRRRS